MNNHAGNEQIFLYFMSLLYKYLLFGISQVQVIHFLI